MKIDLGKRMRACATGTLSLAALAAVALLAIPAVPAAAETLRVAIYAGPNHIFYREGWEPFTKTVEERTGGEVSFKIFHSEQLGKAADSVRLVQTGIADIVFLALPYHGQELPASQAINLPWGWDEQAAANTLWRAIHEPGAIHEEWERAGLVPLMIYSNPSYEFSATSTPLPDLASLKDLKMRSPGDIYGPMLRSIGVVPVEIKSTEQYEALQRGLLDATIYTFSSWKSFSVDELLKHTTLGNKVITVTGLTLATTPAVLERLSPKNREIMFEVGREFMKAGQAAVLRDDRNALKDFEAGGLQTYTWDDTNKAALREKLATVVADWGGKASDAGLDGPQILKEIEAFRAETVKAPDEIPAYGPTN